MSHTSSAIESSSEPCHLRQYHFSPVVGRWKIEFHRIARQIGSRAEAAVSSLESEVESLLSLGSARPQSPDSLRFAFALSLLLDILKSGGQIRVLDSELYVSWPKPRR